ncbi:MAG: NADH-quinone oxidoreductase subunit H, partial [Spirochaetota bacterium]
AQRKMVILIATELPIAIAIVTIAWKMNFLAPGYEPFAIGTVASHPFWSGMGPLGIMGGMLLVFTFMIIIPAEVAKIPFDQSEAESEIAEGLLSEYSGKHLAFFQLGESVKAIAVVSLAVVLFFPHSFTALTGYRVVPLGVDITLIVDIVFFLFKTFIVYTFSISLIRVSMARFKISQISHVFIYILSIISLSGFLLIYLDPSILTM